MDRAEDGVEDGKPCSPKSKLKKGDQQALQELLGQNDGKITKTEERAVGSVKISVYLTYLRSWGPCFIVPILLFANGFLSEALRV